VLFLIAALLRPFGVAAVLPFMIAASAFWIDAALRSTGETGSHLWNVVFAAFGLRWGLAIAFYCASLYHWPVARSLQAGNGFWLFCMDAVNYHASAPRVLEALVWDLPFPMTDGTIDYYLVIAFIYRLFGSSPLTAIAINILAWTLASVFIVRLFDELRANAMPPVLVTVISFWPSGLIWPTQLMKDSLVALFVVLSATAVVRLIRSRSIVLVASCCAGLCLALIPLLRLRIYDGRIVAAGAFVSAIAGALLSRLTSANAWLSAGLAVLAGVVALGVLYIGFPDPYRMFAPADPVRSYLRYAEALEAEGKTAEALEAYRQAALALAEREKALGLAPPGRTTERKPPTLARLEARLLSAVSDSVAALSPESLGKVRESFMNKGDSRGLAHDVDLNSWRDVIRFLPVSIIDGLFAPLPSDMWRPRGITGQFRTFAVSESMLMIALAPAIAIGLLRLRRTEEFFVAALAAGGIVALSLVITNIGTLFRLRSAFTLILVAFAAYGFDVYPRAARLVLSSHRADRIKR
jgi:hypothetical protein